MGGRGVQICVRFCNNGFFSDFLAFFKFLAPLFIFNGFLQNAKFLPVSIFLGAHTHWTHVPDKRAGHTDRKTESRVLLLLLLIIDS